MSAIAFLNGSYVPAAEAVVPVTDAGFVLGVTVAEQVRTFRGTPFRLAKHLDRLFRGLEIVGVVSPYSAEEFAAIVQQVASHNHRLLAADDDLGVTLFVTPGIYSAYGGDTVASPTCGVHTYSLQFRHWCQRYESGAVLQSVGVQQVSTRSWPPDLKCRSRMHYYLASHEARARRPGSMAVLMDDRGFVTETPTANIVAYLPDEGLVWPCQDHILPGISLATLRELAGSRGIRITDRALTMEDLMNAQEVMVTSTPFCLLPIAEVDGRSLPSNWEIYRQLLAAWNELVGIDIAKQARQFSGR